MTGRAQQISSWSNVFIPLLKFLLSQILADSGPHENLLPFHSLSLTLISILHIPLPLSYHTGLPLARIFGISVWRKLPQATLPHLDDQCLDLPNLPKNCSPLRPLNSTCPLLIIAQTCEQSKCLPTQKWINLWYGLPTYMQWNFIQPLNKTGSLVEMWMDECGTE